jgi:hypothetical protein
MAGEDPYGGEVPSPSHFWQHTIAVTPSDTVDLPRASNGLFVAAAGNVAFITTGGDTVNLIAVPAWTLLHYRVARVKLTGTTATVLAGY